MRIFKKGRKVERKDGWSWFVTPYRGSWAVPDARAMAL